MPVWRETADRLFREGKLEYGAAFPWSSLEKDWNVKRNGRGWLRDWLAFRDYLNTLGFYVSQAGQNEKGFRLLTREEMAEWTHRVELRKVRNSAKNALTLGIVDRTGLSQQDVASLDLWQRKCGIIAHAGMAVIRKRTLPPTPDMPIKSVKQIK